MRVDVPGTSDWIEMRGPDELNGGDRRAYKQVWARFAARDLEVGAPPEDGDEDEAPPKSIARRITVTADVVNEEHDTLLERLVTGWSYTHVQPPCTPAAFDELPLAACDVLDKALGDVLARIRGNSGPKAETTPTTSTSGPSDTSLSPQPA